jgi:antitoxin (DNA-binding transcriptional repressor) of toxin-antitoxin stability system
MKTVSKSELKAKMLEYFRIIEHSGEELIVTSHGNPVLKVIPLQPKSTVVSVFGDLRGKTHIDDSIMLPETEEWDELQ